MKIPESNFLSQYLSKSINGEFNAKKLIYTSDKETASGEIKITSNLNLNKKTHVPETGNIKIKINNFSIDGLVINSPMLPGGMNIPPIKIKSISSKIIFKGNVKNQSKNSGWNIPLN